MFQDKYEVDLNRVSELLLYAGLLLDTAIGAVQGAVSPEKQAAFADCMRDALTSSANGSSGAAVALQGLQGFITGNG